MGDLAATSFFMLVALLADAAGVGAAGEGVGMDGAGLEEAGVLLADELVRLEDDPLPCPLPEECFREVFDARSAFSFSF